MTAMVNLAACGFQLRGADLGSIDLNYSISTLQGQDFDEQHRLLVEALEAAMIEAGARRGSGGVNLEILALQSEIIDRATSPVAQASEKIIRLQLKYLVTDAQGESVVGPQQFAFQRAFQVDRSNLLGSYEQQRLLQAEMLANVARQIVRGLAVVLVPAAAPLAEP